MPLKTVTLLVSVLASLLGAMAPVSAAVHRYTEAAYLSGGVGADERARMERLAPEYNLQLEFSTAGEGAYLSDVDVLIQDQQGHTVLRAPSAGPWFFASLPPGDYRVSAFSRGTTRVEQIRVGARPIKVGFTWQETAARPLSAIAPAYRDVTRIQKQASRLERRELRAMPSASYESGLRSQPLTTSMQAENAATRSLERARTAEFARFEEAVDRARADAWYAIGSSRR